VFGRSTGEQEQLIAIIRSVLHDSREMFSVNLRNAGAISGLPGDAAVEIPGVATARGLRPLQVPDLSPPLVAILAQRLVPVRLAIEAALAGDRRLVVEAIIADGAVTRPDAARALADALIEAQARFLPAFA
jgi:alpha-galactosidase